MKGLNFVSTEVRKFLNLGKITMQMQILDTRQTKNGQKDIQLIYGHTLYSLGNAWSVRTMAILVDGKK